MRKLLSLTWLCLFTACSVPVAVAPINAPDEIQWTQTPLAISTPKATATQTQFFTVYGDKPIVSKGQPGAWDDRFTDPGAVIYHDGMFYMFRNGFRDFPGESEVGLVTSSDGYVWTKQGDDPIIRTKDIPYAKVAMYSSSVLWQDGCWELFFYTWDSPSYPSSSVIGRTTQCVAGPALSDWIPDPDPLLIPGDGGEWDEKQVLTPHVLKTDQGYMMYYSGADASGIQRIGMATSVDGVIWEKYNDPMTTSKPFVNSDPVFQPGETGQWDAGWVHQPRVFQTEDGWLMIYRGVSDRRGTYMKLGLATSQDGIHWERYSGNPVFKPSDIKSSSQFWFTNAILKDNVLYLYIEGDIHQTTQIYLATSTGEVLP